MICKNCGASVEAGLYFCTSCGIELEGNDNVQQQQKQPENYQQQNTYQQQSAYQQQNVYQQQNPYQQQNAYQANYQPYPEHSPAVEREIESASNTSLIFGILAMIFLAGGPLGLIFSIIGKAKSNKAYSLNNRMSMPGKAKTGRILSNISMPFSIITTIIYFIYGFILFVALLESM